MGFLGSFIGRIILGFALSAFAGKPKKKTQTKQLATFGNAAFDNIIDPEAPLYIAYGRNMIAGQIQYQRLVPGGAGSQGDFWYRFIRKCQGPIHGCLYGSFSAAEAGIQYGQINEWGRTSLNLMQSPTAGPDLVNGRNGVLWDRYLQTQTSGVTYRLYLGRSDLGNAPNINGNPGFADSGSSTTLVDAALNEEGVPFVTTSWRIRFPSNVEVDGGTGKSDVVERQLTAVNRSGDDITSIVFGTVPFSVISGTPYQLYDPAIHQGTDPISVGDESVPVDLLPAALKTYSDRAVTNNPSSVPVTSRVTSGGIQTVPLGLDLAVNGGATLYDADTSVGSSITFTSLKEGLIINLGMVFAGFSAKPVGGGGLDSTSRLRPVKVTVQITRTIGTGTPVVETVQGIVQSFSANSVSLAVTANDQTDHRTTLLAEAADPQDRASVAYGDARFPYDPMRQPVPGLQPITGVQSPIPANEYDHLFSADLGHGVLGGTEGETITLAFSVLAVEAPTVAEYLAFLGNGAGSDGPLGTDGYDPAAYTYNRAIVRVTHLKTHYSDLFRMPYIAYIGEDFRSDPLGGSVPSTRNIIEGKVIPVFVGTYDGGQPSGSDPDWVSPTVSLRRVDTARTNVPTSIAETNPAAVIRDFMMDSLNGLRMRAADLNQNDFAELFDYFQQTWVVLGTETYLGIITAEEPATHGPVGVSFIAASLIGNNIVKNYGWSVLIHGIDEGGLGYAKRAISAFDPELGQVFWKDPTFRRPGPGDTYEILHEELAFQMDALLPDRRRKEDHLEALLQCCRCVLTLQDGKRGITFLKDEAPSFIFNSHNILADEEGRTSLEFRDSDRKFIPNQVWGIFRNWELEYATDRVPADDQADQTLNDLAEIEVNFVGITRASQAGREARFLLDRARSEDREFTWQGGPSSAESVRAGSVVTLYDPADRLPDPVLVRVTRMSRSSERVISYEGTLHDPEVYGFDDPIKFHPAVRPQRLEVFSGQSRRPPDPHSVQALPTPVKNVDGTVTPLVTVLWHKPPVNSAAYIRYYQVEYTRDVNLPDSQATWEVFDKVEGSDRTILRKALPNLLASSSNQIRGIFYRIRVRAFNFNGLSSPGKNSTGAIDVFGADAPPPNVPGFRVLDNENATLDLIWSLLKTPAHLDIIGYTVQLIESGEPEVWKQGRYPLAGVDVSTANTASSVKRFYGGDDFKAFLAADNPAGSYIIIDSGVGVNVGQMRRITSYDAVAGWVGWGSPLGGPIQIGDTFHLVAGMIFYETAIDSIRSDASTFRATVPATHPEGRFLTGSYSFLIKAVDSSGNESVTASSSTLTIEKAVFFSFDFSNGGGLLLPFDQGLFSSRGLHPQGSVQPLLDE